MEPVQSESDQLSNLMTYTVFHLGAYITLGAAVIAAGAITNVDHPALRFSLICMLIAGACGGVIASNIPEYKTWEDFVHQPIGPWGRHWFTYSTLATMEHAVFWAGLLVPALVYLFCGAAPFKLA